MAVLLEQLKGKMILRINFLEKKKKQPKQEVLELEPYD